MDSELKNMVFARRTVGGTCPVPLVSHPVPLTPDSMSAHPGSGGYAVVARAEGDQADAETRRLGFSSISFSVSHMLALSTTDFLFSLDTFLRLLV